MHPRTRSCPRARSLCVLIAIPEAVPAFKNVMSTYQSERAGRIKPSSTLARTPRLSRHWKEAASAFDDYVKPWPNGKERREAERYRALAHLSIKDDKGARQAPRGASSAAAEDPVTAARWTNLAALAALRDGAAIACTRSRAGPTSRVRSRSYPALIARARLKENGGSVPPMIEPAESGNVDSLSIELPSPADMLHRIGFDGEAEEALREHEPAVAARFPARRTEALCAAYAELDRAKRRYQISLQVPSSQLLLAPGPKNRNAWECVFPEPYPGDHPLIGRRVAWIRSRARLVGDAPGERVRSRRRDLAGEGGRLDAAPARDRDADGEEQSSRP